MPEGPEIRRAADRIGAVLEGETAHAVVFGLEHLRGWDAALTGDTITAVRSRAKAMLIDFAGGWTVYSHNQLYGKWMVRKTAAEPKTNRSLRLAIHTDRGVARLYSASDIEVWSTERLDEQPYLRKLGPDALEASTKVPGLTARVRSQAFSRRRLAGLLLDQGFVAGLGNYLRSEILFEAGLAPTRTPGSLDDDESLRLARALKQVTVRAYEQAGVTLTQVAADDHGLDLTRRGRRHFVFAQAGRPCLRCGASIERHEFAGRRLYLCPDCQR